jgi:hypothetical protein
MSICEFVVNLHESVSVYSLASEEHVSLFGGAAIEGSHKKGEVKFPNGGRVLSNLNGYVVADETGNRGGTGYLAFYLV